jgi:hypothetical protein
MVLDHGVWNHSWGVKEQLQSHCEKSTGSNRCTAKLFRNFRLHGKTFSEFPPKASLLILAYTLTHTKRSTKEIFVDAQVTVQYWLQARADSEGQFHRWEARSGRRALAFGTPRRAATGFWYAHGTAQLGEEVRKGPPDLRRSPSFAWQRCLPG